MFCSTSPSRRQEFGWLASIDFVKFPLIEEFSLRYHEDIEPLSHFSKELAVTISVQKRERERERSSKLTKLFAFDSSF